MVRGKEKIPIPRVTTRVGIVVPLSENKRPQSLLCETSTGWGFGDGRGESGFRFPTSVTVLSNLPDSQKRSKNSTVRDLLVEMCLNSTPVRGTWFISPSNSGLGITIIPAYNEQGNVTRQHWSKQDQKIPDPWLTRSRVSEVEPLMCLWYPFLLSFVQSRKRCFERGFWVTPE